MQEVKEQKGSLAEMLLRLAFLLGLLFLFLVAINLMSGSFKAMGTEKATALFEGIRNPFAGLAVGILATVLVQSSSVTTSTIVALVGSGQVDVSSAVPMIMGANIGTTITNTIVSIGHVRRGREFKRAFAAATVHDFFNVIAVSVLLPLELITGFLSKSAIAISSTFDISNDGGDGFKSPIKQVVKDVAKYIQSFVTETLGISGVPGTVVLLLLALVLIFISLNWITKTMRLVIADRAEQALNAALKKSGLAGIVIGAGITVSVQSSSITTSLLVPLCGSGVLSLANAFPVMLGANIGTTITAFLASLTTDINGLTIAIVHFLFNIAGVLMIYPIKALRQIPLNLATGLAERAATRPLWVLAYVGTVFVVIPLVGILLFR